MDWGQIACCAPLALVNRASQDTSTPDLLPPTSANNLPGNTRMECKHCGYLSTALEIQCMRCNLPCFGCDNVGGFNDYVVAPVQLQPQEEGTEP